MMPLTILSSLLLIAASQAQELLSNQRCNFQMDRGSCSQFTVNWYYDRYGHRCRRFYYGGCEGNANRFRTLEECSATCRYVAPTNRDRCFQPHDPGHCDRDIERWYFDKDRLQCVCSWWSGCGGNSNLFFSYNHCMFVCGEFAKRGPGIDEKYWASRNRSMPLGGGQRPYQPYVHPSMQLVAEQRPQPPRVRPSSGYKQIDRDRGRYDGYRDRMTTMDYEELKRLHEEYYRRYPTTPPPGRRQSRNEEASYRYSQNDSFASGYAEFRTLPSHNSSPQAQSYLIPYRSSTQRRPRGERIYRYDTGPIKQTHPDGTVTINRQVIYITENRRPSMTLHQRLPGLIEFTHITPPPPFSTMITPLLRRRLKKLMKEKVLPRTTNPPKISSPIPEQETHFERGSVVREDVTQPSIAPSSVRAKDTTDENYNYIRHSTSRESDGRRSTLPTTSMTYRNQGSTLTTSQYPLRYQPDMKQTSAKPVVTDAEHSLRSSPSPIIRIEAERLDISRPVVISVSPKEVDFDEVLAIDSKIYDDYDDTFNDLNFDNTHPELPTTATSVPIGITPSNKMESRHHTSTLKPIVSPPASSQGNMPYTNEARTHAELPSSKTKTRNSQPLFSSPAISKSVGSKSIRMHQTAHEPMTESHNYELSTTQADFGEEDTETVEFEIQPVGVDS
ncbi:hypothetical protein Angca_006386 [Angiostrongylus cantonensis]|nr:hypothetical protein Angca_006386 [Angiostrongylus cantonensis]